MACYLEVVDLTKLPPAQTVLSLQEQAYYQTLRVPKRRSEWLGGRLALKRLAASTLCVSDWTQLEILPHASGKPQLCISGQPVAAAYSITHSHGVAVAGLSTDDRFLGIDLEKIEPRISAWANDFFQPDELTSTTDDFLTALWTQKEALVKLLGVGLALRSSEVCCVKGIPRFSGRALRIYESLGKPVITLKTEPWPGGFMFSVASGK